MHETSYNEMKRFVEKYLDRDQELKIIEIGSLDVNGSYRPLFDSPHWTYTGLDLDAGKNVDIVADDPYNYPLESNSFDVVISGSTLEHVEDMHAFIKEAARIMKKDGIMCVIAPWTYPEHKYPVDCWRILPDGMRFLLSKIAGINVLNVHKNAEDCIGIAGTLKKHLKVSMGVMVNDIGRLNMVLMQSEIPTNIKCHMIKLPESAVSGLNKLLDLIDKDGADIAVLTHQDMYYRKGWIEQVETQLLALPDSWVVAGVVGKDMTGAIQGSFRDMRVPLTFERDQLPCPASCFDECCLIINMKTGFRFDTGLNGWDLYGTMAVCQTWEMGGTAWIIDAYAEHYCLRPFTWVPGKEFEDAFRWLHSRFPNAPRIDTTVLGVPFEENPARYDDLLREKVA
jgi:SAM-dependent methyltransferase